MSSSPVLPTIDSEKECIKTKLLWKSINSLYRFKRLVVIDLSRVDKNDMINEIWNNKNDMIW